MREDIVKEALKQIVSIPSSVTMDNRICESIGLAIQVCDKRPFDFDREELDDYQEEFDCINKEWRAWRFK